MRVLSISDIVFVSGGSSNDAVDAPKRNIYDVLPILGAAMLGSLATLPPGDWAVKGIVLAATVGIAGATLATMYYFEMVPYEFIFPNDN